MDEAIRLADAAGQLGNVPVGAVLVIDGEVVGRGSNLREVLQDPTAHAELLALRDATQRLGRWRLQDATLYVTLEPCTMCAGAIAQSRVQRVVYAATEPKMGAIVSQRRLLPQTETLHLEGHTAQVQTLMRTFFEQLRRSVRVVEGA